MAQHSLKPAHLVQVAGNQLITTSQLVADVFGRQHKDVLRRIRELDCSPDFNQRNFTPVDYLDDKGQKRPSYDISKDGFIFLVMGFTGPKAAQAKEAYINAFNQMAERLAQAAVIAAPAPMGVTISQNEYVELLKAKIALLESQPRRRVMTEAERQQMRLLARAGLSPIEIAERLGRPYESVRSFLRREDLL